MILQAYGSAAVLIAAALLVGYALNLMGCSCRTAAPAVGFSVLIVVSFIAIKLPGRGTTAVVTAVTVVVASGVLIALRRPWSEQRRARWTGIAPAVAAAISAFGATIPFIANGRIGLLGVSLDNDTAAHLRWAQALRVPVVGTRYGLNTAYPVGPHSVADVLSSVLGARLDLAFTGLMIGTVVLTALVGAAALRDEAGWKRVAAGVLASLFYLIAAYYGEGAFKEQIMALLLLATVLQLESIRVEWVSRTRARWLMLLPLAAMFAAGIYTYSYPALAWLALTIVIWIAAEVVSQPRCLKGRVRQARDAVAPGAVAVGALVIMTAPVIGQLASFARGVGLSPAASGVVSTSNLGNLAYALSPYEGLGIWNQTDFRFTPVNLFHAGQLGTLALGVLILGLVWSLGRRQLILPAAIAAAAIVYWRSSAGQSPYLTAKALVIPGTVVAVCGLRALLSTPATPLPRWVALSRLGVAIVFVVFALHSSYLALRDEPVWGNESTNELLTLDHYTRGQTLLFLGHSDYASWIFSDSKMSALAADTVSLGEAGARPNKPFVYGTDFDFDSVDPATINRFEYFITTNTTYASQPPAGVELVRRLRMYELWKRVGQIPSHQVLEPPGAPGAILNCHNQSERTLSRRRGIAAVMAPPQFLALSPLQPGQVHRLPLILPPGVWNLSLQYTSPVSLDLSTLTKQWTMPAYTDRPGPVFSVGTVSSSGAAMLLTVHAQRPSFMSGPTLLATPTQLIATQSPETTRIVPLAQACGRYVDWFKLSA